MIYIREVTPPRKFSGLSSFLISFAYSKEVWDVCNSFTSKAYLKSEQCFEIPSNELSDALDRLCFYDSLQLIMLPPSQEPEPDPKTFCLTDDEIRSFSFTPFDHQITGINYGLDPRRKKWLLLDSMGLGKTLEIIGYAETLKRRGLIDHCMIICGVDSLRQNWKSEIRKFSREGVMVLGEKVNSKGTISYATIKARAERLMQPIDEFFVVINAATLRSDDIIKALRSPKNPNKFGLMAVDEAHRFTSQSAQGNNLLKLDAEYKVAATGTLLLNSPVSCYLPLSWTDNDHATLTHFKEQYCVKGGINGAEIISYQNLPLLREELGTCSIRRTLDQVRSDMPAKNINYECIEMNDQHRKFYEAIKAGIKDEADKINLNNANLLALTTRLRQATVSPSILTTQDIASSKLDRAAEIARDLISQGEKVVIFGSFKEPIYKLQSMLAEFDPLVCTGDMSEQVITQNVNYFQGDPKPKLMLCTHSKMGTGFTLNAASYMICLDTPYTDASFSQSTDRIWRITNDRPAFVTVLVCKDTIDERVKYIVETKKELSDYVVDGKENYISDSLANELRSIIVNL